MGGGGVEYDGFQLRTLRPRMILNWTEKIKFFADLVSIRILYLIVI